MIVEGCLKANYIDLQGDVITPDCMKRIAKQIKKGDYVFDGFNTDRIPIGKVLSVHYDGLKGLIYRIMINRLSERIRMFPSYSMGLWGRGKTVTKNGCRIINDMEIYEVSLSAEWQKRKKLKQSEINPISKLERYKCI